MLVRRGADGVEYYVPLPYKRLYFSALVYFNQDLNIEKKMN